MKSVILALLLVILPIYGQQKVTIVNTEDDGDPPLGHSELIYLTDMLRATALKTLPQKNYSILTIESVVASLGSYEAVNKKFKNADGSLTKLGWELNTDYIGQARIGRFDKNYTIKVELYETKTGDLKSSFTAQAKDMYALVSVLEKESPSLFNRLQSSQNQSLVQTANVTPVNDALMFYKQGLSYFAKGDYDKAIKNYNKALKLIIKDQMKEKPEVIKVVNRTPKPTGGAVPISVIPTDIREEFKASMPIFSGTTPPDISGEYLASPYIITSSSLESDVLETKYSDRFIAFIDDNKGNLSYKGKQGTGSGGSENVVVEIVGKDNSFTAYFVSTGKNKGINTKTSVVISGTITTYGISNFHYGFILLEKGPDPEDKLLKVNTYRTFKDADGLAVRYEWLSD